MKEPPEWMTAANIQRLRAQWLEGTPASEIGHMLGASKNAIIGKARRLGLDQRPNPMRPIGPARPAARPRGAVTLPKLPSLRAIKIAVDTDVVRLPTPPGARVTVPRPVPALVAALAAPIRLSLVRSCCWPIGEPRDRANFHFCDDPVGEGRSYCTAHHRMAHARTASADIGADPGRPANSSHILDSL